MDLYTGTLGAWSWGLISLVAFLTMFSTTLTTLDGRTTVVVPSGAVTRPVKVSYAQGGLGATLVLLTTGALPDPTLGIGVAMRSGAKPGSTAATSPPGSPSRYW